MDQHSVLTSQVLSDINLAKQTCIGKQIYDLPVPAFVLDKHRVVNNINRMLTKINDPEITGILGKNLEFRPHIKTLKSENVTRASLGYNIDGKDTEADNISPKYHGVVASTLAEIRGCKPLVLEGKINDIIYGIPISKSHFSELTLLRKEFNGFGCDISLFVDNINQLELFQQSDLINPWKLMMKIDADEHRAGIKLESPEFFEFLKGLTSTNPKSSYVLRGFYAHAGASYDANDLNSVRSHLLRELQAVTDASYLARKHIDRSSLDNGKNIDNMSFLLSIGATPTANALSHPDLVRISTKKLHPNDTLELHAGNFVALDLQQVATSLVGPEDIAGYVLTEIISYYKTRSKKYLAKNAFNCDTTSSSEKPQSKNDIEALPSVEKKVEVGGPEYLVNAGVIALTREPGHGDPSYIPAAQGIAQVKGFQDWIISRVSQEHGILEFTKSPLGKDEKTLKPWKLGDKICLYPQHVCITAAMHKLYFVVDDGDIIVDVWEPWKYW